MKIWLNFNQVTKIYSISHEFGYQLVSQVKLSPPLGGDKYPSMTELQTDPWSLTDIEKQHTGQFC